MARGSVLEGKQSLRCRRWCWSRDSLQDRDSFKGCVSRLSGLSSPGQEGMGVYTERIREQRPSDGAGARRGSSPVSESAAVIRAQEKALSPLDGFSAVDQPGGRPAVVEDAGSAHRPEYGMLKSLSTGSLSTMARAGVLSIP